MITTTSCSPYCTATTTTLLLAPLTLLLLSALEAPSSLSWMIPVLWQQYDNYPRNFIPWNILTPSCRILLRYTTKDIPNTLTNAELSDCISTPALACSQHHLITTASDPWPHFEDAPALDASVAWSTCRPTDLELPHTSIQSHHSPLAHEWSDVWCRCAWSSCKCIIFP